MNIRNFVGAFVAVAACAALTVPAQAQQTTFATISSTGGATAFSYTSGSGFGITGGQASSFLGILTFGSGAPSVDIPVTVSFSGLTDVGNVTNVGSTYTQALTGGSFTVLDSSSNLLLAGDFGSAKLTGDIGATTGNVATVLNSVNYTGGSYFAASGLFNPGAFSINLTSISGGGLSLNGSGTKFNSFQSSGSGTFSASAAVPEPGEYAAMALLGLTVCGLMVRARRRSNMVA